MKSKTANTVLLIEDNPADVETVRRATSKLDYEIDLVVISGGLEARELINERTAADGSTGVNLVLLDLNLPGISGRELLELFDSTDSWGSVPVVVLTTSNNEADIKKAYQHGANCYLVKPGKTTEFVKMITSVCSYWLQVIG